MTRITRIIIDRPVEIADGHRTPALNHLRRHFRIEGIAELSYATSLRDALAACGIESSTSEENVLRVTGFDRHATFAAHVLQALRDVAQYVTPGGHLLAVTDERRVVTLRFENAQLRTPELHGERNYQPFSESDLDEAARLLAKARSEAAERGHDLGYFHLTPYTSSPEIFGEAKCRRCHESACFSLDRKRTLGRAVTAACARPARERPHTEHAEPPCDG